MVDSCATHVHLRTFIHTVVFVFLCIFVYVFATNGQFLCKACPSQNIHSRLCWSWWHGMDCSWCLLTIGSTLEKYTLLFRNSIVLHRLHLHSVPFHPFLSTNLRELAVAAVAVVVTAAVAVAVVLNSSLFTENSGTRITCLSNSVNRNRQNAVWKTWKGGDSFLFAPILFFGNQSWEE